jgi:4-amino-4-deoxy-L-arabinose transferase-like glycosyltransferase
VPASSQPSGASTVRVALLIGVVAIALRAWLAASVPLMDTTEARFGEMARKMVVTGDWLTPQHDFGVPYLAKPPLAIWLAAGGIEIAGATELGPRAPIFAVGLAFCGALFLCARRWLGTEAGVTSLLVLLTSALFYASLAAVMTDLVLTICVGAALLAFWARLRGGDVRAELVLYAALGIGLLAKGPLAWVLSLGPIATWAVVRGRAAEVWSRFAWCRGLALALLIAAPWYLLAEQRNPGFLQYFLVGEHLGRFLVPGWDGDLYGRAHDVPRGTIWLFFAVGALPWSLLCVPILARRRDLVRRNWRERRELVLFAATAALAPLALFTLSGNVILPYALPALPPAALAFAALVSDSRPGGTPREVLVVSAVAVATFALLAVGGAQFLERHSQRAMLEEIRAHHETPDAPIFYWRKRYLSADYYGGHAVRMVLDAAPIEAALARREPFCLVIADHRRGELPPSVAEQLVPVAVVGEHALLEPTYITAQGS